MFSFLYRYGLSVAVSCRQNISQHKQIMAIHDVCRILFQSVAVSSLIRIRQRRSNRTYLIIKCRSIFMERYFFVVQ